MKVVPISSRMPFKFLNPRAEPRVPEGLKLAAGVVSTCWMPTLLFCSTIGTALPFFLTFYCEVLGTLFGLLMYLHAPNRMTSCIPVTRIPRSPAQRIRSRDKHAA